MRRLAALALPVLALSACYGPAYQRSYDRWSDGYGVPLAARIEPVGSGLSLRLNRPAYVAVFQILPGRGVGLYYPAFGGEDAYFGSGTSLLPLHGARYFDSYYYTRRGAGYGRDEPTFYLLVASRRPLRSITRFQRSDGALRSVLGLTAYSTVDYRRVMDDLVDVVVPPQSEEDWTTDVYAVWPRSDYGYYADNGGYTRVRCWDGTYQLVPWELSRWACTRSGTDGVARIPNSSPPPHNPGDTATVNAPGRHRPEPGNGAPGGTSADQTRGRPVPQIHPTEQTDHPRMTDDGSRSPSSREGGARQPAEHPRVEAPRSEPRSEPTRSEPRSVPTRSEPRSESPRVEPSRSEPARSEPSPPRSDSAPSRPEPAPAPPPAS